LEELVVQGGATCRFFEGPYGAGKTHLLRMLGDSALRSGLAVVKADLSHDLSLENWKLLALHVLDHLEAIIDGQLVRSVPEILRALGDGRKENLQRLRDAKLSHSGFKNAMMRAVQGTSLPRPAWDLLRRFLLGERLRVADLRSVGLTGVKNPLSNRNAEHVLNTVLSGLFHVGLPGTMLQFDEHEKSFVSYRYAAPPKRT